MNEKEKVYNLGQLPEVVVSLVRRTQKPQNSTLALIKSDKTQYREIPLTNNVLVSDISKFRDPKARGILGSSFIEKTTSRTDSKGFFKFMDKDYKLSDNGKFKLGDAKRFYGIRNGLFHVGELNDFNDEDLVTAVREVDQVFDEKNPFDSSKYMGKLEANISGLFSGGKKYIVYSNNPNKRNYTFILGTDKDINNWAKKNGGAHVILLDNGRFLGNVVKDTPLTDSDYNTYVAQGKTYRPIYALTLRKKGGRLKLIPKKKIKNNK